MSDIREETAVVRGMDLQLEGRGFLILSGHFEYQGGGCQGLGYGMDAEFLKSFLRVFNAERLQQVNGKPCIVRIQHGIITGLRPVHSSLGQEFDIDAWVEKKRAAAGGRP